MNLIISKVEGRIGLSFKDSTKIKQQKCMENTHRSGHNDSIIHLKHYVLAATVRIIQIKVVVY